LRKVGEIADLASSMATSARDQAAQIGTVRQTVGNLDAMTQQNAALVEGDVRRRAQSCNGSRAHAGSRQSVRAGTLTRGDVARSCS
jgi:hypothetical protein